MSRNPRRIKATNLGAQLRYRGRGNPPSSSPDSAPSNCFPGLVADFRVVWRRILVGIVLHEANNYVVQADPPHTSLLHRRLLRIDDVPLVTTVFGPARSRKDDADGPPIGPLMGGDEDDGLAVLEWANALAAVAPKAGLRVPCVFTKTASDDRTLSDLPAEETETHHLEVRRFFNRSAGTEVGGSGVIAEELVQPGELTQGLCSPWQSDFRECACYYWAASRPDYVNVVHDVDVGSRGHNWMQKNREGAPQYVLDDGVDRRLLTERDLLNAWERVLKFVIGGKDTE